MEQEIISKKKKWYKKKTFYIILVAVLLVGGFVYSKISSSNKTPQYETVKVVKGTLVQTVDATGSVESANDLSLRFEASGRLARLYKKVNDSVKKGEVLAELDLSEHNASVAQASASLSRAEADLDKQLAGNTPDYLANLQASLTKAEADLIQAQGLTPGVETSKLVEKAYEDMLVSLQVVQNTLASSLTTTDNILGIDNVLANDSFEKILSNLDDTALASAESNYRLAKISKTNFDVLVNSLNKSSDHLKIDNAVIKSKDALQDMKSLLFAIANMLDKTAPIGTLTQTSLDTLKTGIQTARTSVVNKYSEILTYNQAIDTARNSYNAYLAAVDKAQASLNDAQNPPREVDVAAYRAAVNSAEAGLSQAVANRNKARIVAPVVGMIGKIVPQVGEYVSAQGEVINLVSQHFEVKVDIPETDIIKIKNGDVAEIKLDAYGDDLKFSGLVTQIEKGQTVIQDVVYYRVTISLEDNQNKQILSGMTANVVFSTEKKDGILFLPQRAVRTNEDGSKYVRILENKVLKELNIKTGLRGDGGLVEITEGLSEDQEVVVSAVTA
ncbi:MAG: Efflux transporter, RND family, MFP subunit [Candidatus Magasanikbacteria bacterium GW2011_GWC2_37_14]|uniref:Efflux transporter, RND family, MFP subunit n=1 Tax=Candidatus Magasanikbacteria bacterium GW2011_GWC2_37_14 TaxID=1619046 RepID=A0A0G0GAV2_9BACT|nr:MAG: Efflux transporter, RND family, MFP subunit [Candidatus Magasanikbacteria bacterium GW2011_GWC2_37_14]